LQETPKDNLLRSWKEIAAYLECTVRTCHRWEDKHGMPVHRAEGTEGKSPVFAYKDELDAWFKETFRNHNRLGEKAKKAGKDRPALKWALGAIAVLVLAGALFLLRAPGRNGQPADFAIEGSVFIALDKQKRELWRWDTGMEDLKPEEFYRKNFQVRHPEESNILPLLVIKDINADGDAEVLFAPKRTSEQTGEGWLYCFDREGAEIWSFPAGKELRCGGTVYSPDYRISGFYCHDLEGDGLIETVVKAYHAPDWPCQLAVLDAAGKRTGEFWNAGYLVDLAFHDLDGDGREELIVAGVNNDYRGGCLAVFDTRKIAGSSPQTGKYACEGLGPGSMLYYVTVPYTDVAEAMGHSVAGFAHLDVKANNRIMGTTSTSLIYEFGFDLAFLQVTDGNGFKVHHREMALLGRISSVLDDAYLAALRAGVRWWNGSEMVAKPAKNPR